MWFWIIGAAVAVVLLALAWWSSGRVRPGVPKASGAAETGRGQATGQAVIHRDGQHGTGLF
jgi:hypothetical protein